MPSLARRSRTAEERRARSGRARDDVLPQEPECLGKAGGSPVTEADMAVDDLLRHDAARRAAGLRLAVGGDRRRSRAARARHDLRRRSDRRHARLHRGRRALVREPCRRARTDGRSSLRSTRRRAASSSPRSTAGAAPGRQSGSVSDRIAARRRAPCRSARLAEDQRRPATRRRCCSRMFPRSPIASLRSRRVGSTPLSPARARHDWDLAACDLLVHEAGGRLTGLDGAVLPLQPAKSRATACSRRPTQPAPAAPFEW